MEEKSRVSIIIPCYNAEKHIEKCIKSIINQTYKNIEIIAIDDGSQDNTLEILNKFKEKDKRINVISKKNTGVSDTRNIGIEKSTGNYIMFVDADDFLEEDAVEKLYNTIINNKVNIVRGMYRRISEKRISDENDILKYNNANNYEIIKSILNGDILCYVWLLMIKKEILQKYNIKFDKNLKIMEDTLFYINIIEKENIYFLNEVIYNYVQNEESATGNVNKTLETYKNMLKAENKIINSLRENNMWKNELNNIVIKKILVNGICNNTWNLYKAKDKKQLKKFIEYINEQKEIKENIIKTDLKNVRRDKKIIINLIINKKIKRLLLTYKIKYIMYKMKENGIKTMKKIRKFLGKCKLQVIVILSKLYYLLIYKKNRYNILDDSEIIDKIVNENKSLARFGDGEFKWMLGVKQVSFQENNKEMQEKLIEIMKEKNENLIIGIPRALNNFQNLNKLAKRIWKTFIYLYYKKVKVFIDENKEYADTNITRFYMDYVDKKDCKEKIESIKKIWEDRHIIIIEGEKTKLGAGNDLLKNAKSIKRILAPSKNAYSKYNEILNEAIKQDKNSIFLISLGPTATILASDLSKKGFQAIDIGHVDIEYEWFKINATEKVPIKGKHVNEAQNKGDLSSEDIEDEEYKKSIIKVIC